MDRDELFKPPFFEIIEDVLTLEQRLKLNDVLFCSWHGGRASYNPPFYYNPKYERMNRGGDEYQPYPDTRHDDRRNPWFKLWEIAAVVEATGVKRMDTVLDIGGCSSLFSYYLASKGVAVTAIDVEEKAISIGDEATQKMRWHNLVNSKMDMRDLRFTSEMFDYVFSLDVLSLVNPTDREKTLKEVYRVLKPNGVFAATSSYQNPNKKRYVDEKSLKRLAYAGGFKLDEIIDNGKRYLVHPNMKEKYTNVAIFFKKGDYFELAISRAREN